jgi:hypothetical protein
MKLKVECLDDFFHAPLKKLYRELPVKGEVYTVRAIFHGRDRLHPTNSFSTTAGLLLEELHNLSDPEQPQAELGFRASRFRPIAEGEVLGE